MPLSIVLGIWHLLSYLLLEYEILNKLILLNGMIYHIPIYINIIYYLITCHIYLIITCVINSERASSSSWSPKRLRSFCSCCTSEPLMAPSPNITQKWWRDMNRYGMYMEIYGTYAEYIYTIEILWIMLDVDTSNILYHIRYGC